MPPALQAVDLHKSYPVVRSWAELARAPFARRRNRALDGLTLELAAGERLALVGPNGAGKTTLARIAMGVVLPDAGEANVSGHKVDLTAGWKAAVGFARPDDPSLHGRLTALECLRFHAALYGVEGRDLRAALDRALAGELAERRLQTLSGGERARVSLAKALLHEPKLLILDELSRVLDPGAAVRVRGLLQAYARAGGAVLLITHDLIEAASCDRVAVMRAGKLVAAGPWGEVEGAAREVFGL
jgi:ABC-2 type transport system ATP-binding protein